MAKLPVLTVELPKTLVKVAKSRSNPTNAASPGDVLPNRALFPLLNTTARSYRTATNLTQLLRHLSRAEGPISGAVHSVVQVANCGHLVTAYDSKTQMFSKEGSLLASSIMASFDTLYDFNTGFSTKKSVEGLKAHALREIVLTGSIAGELVLNESRLPSHIQIVPYESLEMVAGKNGSHYPQQRQAGENDPISLNLPTFFVSNMQHDASSAYSFSMMDSAIKMIVYFEEFMEDIRRVVRQNGHTRLTVALDSEKVQNTAPREIRNDPVKMGAWMLKVQAAVQAQLSNMSPEDAMVFFDSAKVDQLHSGLGKNVDYTPLLGVLSGVYATSMKTPPTVIGLRMESGSQNTGNVESLIFIKTAAAVQTPFEEFMSRILTLSCRLYGLDVYVRFEFDPIDLRPQSELEAFYTMQQTRIMERLSLGFIDDDYAAHLLRTGARPAGAPPLMGTMFHQGKPAAEDNTTPGDTPMGKQLQPDKKVPRKGGGKSQ